MSTAPAIAAKTSGHRVGVVGLGYVGLPLAAAFGQVLPTVGFDVDRRRVAELQKGYDRNGEVLKQDVQAPGLTFTGDPLGLCNCSFVVVAVPTPVDSAKRPDLSPLLDASRTVGRLLAEKARRGESDASGRVPGTIVVYESTVYPGCTEEVCVPILEEESGLKAGRHFGVGYSPERVNPGDPDNTLARIVKVVSAGEASTLETMAQLYGLVVKAGVYRAPDIRTAEAAKVIENVQRDLNIALMNELAMLFHRLGMDTREVLKAAGTKWNFLPFQPGLVGGHCIPVDPYYLTHKAQQVNYDPEMILAGRRINDNMGAYVAQSTARLMTRAGKALKDARVLVLGVAFKENVRDVRNSLVVRLVQELRSYECTVEVYDPLVEAEALVALGLQPVADPFAGGAARRGIYDALVLAVPHRLFRDIGPDSYLGLLKNDGRLGVIADVRGLIPADWLKERRDSFIYWSL